MSWARLKFFIFNLRHLPTVWRLAEAEVERVMQTESMRPHVGCMASMIRGGRIAALSGQHKYNEALRKLRDGS